MTRHIDKNSWEKFEDMFLVKIASKGTSLTSKFPISFEVKGARKMILLSKSIDNIIIACVYHIP